MTRGGRRGYSGFDGDVDVDGSDLVFFISDAGGGRMAGFVAIGTVRRSPEGERAREIYRLSKKEKADHGSVDRPFTKREL